MTDGRYPSTSNYASGEILVTDPIHNLPASIVGSNDYMRPYYMGFIPYDDVPKQCLCTRAERTAQGDIIITEEKARNHGWGFVTCTASAGVPQTYAGYVNASGTVTRGLGTGTSRFINQACMARYATTNVITISLAYIVVPEADLDIRDSAAKTRDAGRNVYRAWCPGTGYQMPSVTVPFISTTTLGDGFDKFFRNEAVLNFGDITVDGETINLSCKAEDFPDDNPTWRKKFTANGTNYILFAQLNSYVYPTYGRYRKAADEAATAVSIVPFIEHDCLETNAAVARADGKWITIGNPTTLASMQIDIDYWYGQTADSVYFNAGSVSSGSVGMGKYYVEGNKMSHGSGLDAYWWCDQTGTIPGYGRDGILHGRHICYNRNNGDNVFDIFPMLRPKDIWYAIAPFHKIDTAHQGQSNTNPQNSYTATYSTQIFDNNAPTETRKQDTTANLLPELMTWQVPSADITTDEFNIDDMPAYEPKEDVMDKFTGDNISFNLLGDFGDTHDFITHWVLKDVEVQAFGSYIWKNLLDPSDLNAKKVWQNILIMGASYINTGQLDPSRLLEYIISLRYFPFELYGHSTATASGNVYFGTGMTGVPVSSLAYARKLNSMAIRLDGGMIKLDPNDEFWYKDFRDYVGSSAAIYIPFCGTYEIPISEVQPDSAFHVWYEIDVASGAMTAYVSSIHYDSKHPLGAFYPVLIANGVCGFEVPITSTNANRLNAQIIGDIQRVVGAVTEPIGHAFGKVVSGLTTAMTASGGNSQAVAGAAGDADVGDALGSVSIGLLPTLAGGSAKEAAGNLLGVAADMMTRPAIGMPLLQGGRGWGALASPLTAYLQLRRGRYLYPDKYAHTFGKPEMHKRKVNSIKGYCECANIDTSGLNCTETERQMVKQILETGFYRK